MTKKYFIISDIHGHYDEMILALSSKGYDSNNALHHLVVIGDMFDRGTQSKEVLEFLYPLSIKLKATVICGNHDNFMIEFFEGNFGRAIFNINNNGMGKTLSSLTGNKLIDYSELEKIKNEISKKYPYLEGWLRSLPSYLEIGEYIFVHGGIDGELEDWRKSSLRDCIWNRQNTLKPVKDKIMVVGHHRVPTIRYPGVNYRKLLIKKPEAFDILYEKKKIFIDAFVEISKKINVLELEI